MDRRVTSPIWGTAPQCKQALNYLPLTTQLIILSCYYTQRNTLISIVISLYSGAYFRIPLKTFCLPQKFCITHCFQMLLGVLHFPKSI